MVFTLRLDAGPRGLSAPIALHEDRRQRELAAILFAFDEHVLAQPQRLGWEVILLFPVGVEVLELRTQIENLRRAIGFQLLDLEGDVRLHLPLVAFGVGADGALHGVGEKE